MNTRINELDLVRTKQALTVEDAGTHHVPAGEVGTVLLVHGDGKAYEVEFVLKPGQFGDNGEILDYPEECLTTLRHDQVEPVA